MSSRQYNVGVVGAGMVGQRLVEVLERRKFPMTELRILATSTRKQVIGGRERELRRAPAPRRASADDLDREVAVDRRRARGCAECLHDHL